MIKVPFDLKNLQITNYVHILLNLLRLAGIPIYYLIAVFLIVFYVLVKKLFSLARLISAYAKIAKPPSFKFKFPKLPKRKTKKGKKIAFNAKAFAMKTAAAFLLAIAVFSVSTFGFWIFLVRDLPPPEALLDRSLEVSTKIYDRNGTLLYQLYKDKNRTLVNLSDVPIHVRLATLAAEDADFYNHPGISPKGISRATYKFLREGKVTSGSTITQQLVKNALLSPEKTVARKAREVLISLAVEQKYSKDEILEMYLNEVSYGGTAYGIQEAAHQYFGKNVGELTLPEAALLAGLPKSPSFLSPFGDPGAAKHRQEEVLSLMLEAGFISPTQMERAKSEELSFVSDKIDIKAPHFVMYVRDQLASMYGEEFIYRNGLEVFTTLDLSVQGTAQRAVVDEIARLAALRVGNGAAIVVNPGNGEILAMVGSRNYFDEEHDGNVNVVMRPRQPGSSIKVVNYAYALEHGFTPATYIDDSPISFNIAGQPPYVPKNYDGNFRGRLTLRSALAESRNVPAVRVLAKMGVINMIEMGRKMGITSWRDPNQYGLSLTLGGGEITLFELSAVYATLANYGERSELHGITKIIDHSGKMLYTHRTQPTPVLDSRIAFILTDILRDNDARAPAFGGSSALVIPGHPEVAVKTGTSNDLKDNLTVGYTQDFLVAVWVGNNDGSPMSRVASGITGASPIWNKIMSTLVSGKEVLAWSPPEGLVQRDACGKAEWFLSEDSDVRCPAPTQNDELAKQARR